MTTPDAAAIADEIERRLSTIDMYDGERVAIPMREATWRAIIAALAARAKMLAAVTAERDEWRRLAWLRLEERDALSKRVEELSAALASFDKVPPRGCVCPPGAEQGCAGPSCPRKSFVVFGAVALTEAYGAGKRDAVALAAGVCDAWLDAHGDTEIKIVSAQQWATDAIEDIADAIRALSPGAHP